MTVQNTKLQEYLRQLQTLHTPRELADMCEVAVSTIQRWASGDAVPHKVVQEHVEDLWKLSFSNLIEDAIALYGAERLAFYLQVSPPTLKRWQQGKNFPYPLAARSVIDRTLELKNS
jgi:DNA-binding transcriptional regulator YiaG